MEKYPTETGLKEKAYELMAAEELTIMEAKAEQLLGSGSHGRFHWSIEKYKKRKG